LLFSVGTFLPLPSRRWASCWPEEEKEEDVFTIERVGGWVDEERGYVFGWVGRCAGGGFGANGEAGGREGKRRKKTGREAALLKWGSSRGTNGKQRRNGREMLLWLLSPLVCFFLM